MDTLLERKTPGVAPSPKLQALTGLRFLAASLVVVHHYLRHTLIAAPKWVDNVAEQGYLAVGLFFLLSGFVLAHRYITPPGVMEVSARRFWTARFARIYPVYLFAFLFSAPFVIANCLQVNGVRTALLKLGFNGILSLGLVQSWTPYTAWYWNAPAWSVSVEAFFYLAFPFFAPVVGRMSRPMLLGVLLAVWSTAMLVPVLCCFSGYGAATVPPVPFLRILLDPGPLFRLPEFVAGVLLGRYFQLENGKNAARAPIFAALGLLGWAALLAFGSSIPRLFYVAGLPLPFSALLILGLAHGRGWIAAFLSTPALVLLGEASYGVYILQWPLASVFGIAAETRSFLWFVSYNAALVLLAILSLKYLEAPARRAILRYFESPQRAASSESHVSGELAVACISVGINSRTPSVQLTNS
jgi:peptidoglycan/LPS O-acetylase OafA/YrhL